MKKNEIINLIKSISESQVSQSILKTIEDSLYEEIDYEVTQDGDSIKINTILKDGEQGSYYEIIYEFDRETKKSSVVTTKKEYCPRNEVRHGYMQEVGFEIFTDSHSYVYDEDGLLLYKSWFSDEHKYYGKERLPLDYSRESLLKYFKDTTPTYEKGVLVQNARSAYTPFKNIWRRYGKTHVVKVNGRNPMNGEYSNVGLTFDSDSLDDIGLLSENHGHIYTRGREMKLRTEEEIVEKIEELYKTFMTPSGFDRDSFEEEFEKEMYVSSRRY